jgi:hypothetical protein
MVLMKLKRKRCCRVVLEIGKKRIIISVVMNKVGPAMKKLNGIIKLKKGEPKTP